MENLPSRQHHIGSGPANRFLQEQMEKTVCKAGYHKGINSFLKNMFCKNTKDKVTGAKYKQKSQGAEQHTEVSSVHSAT